MDSRRQRTKTAIQKALLSLMTVKRYSDITITELAKKAKIGRKTFYLHFANLEDVVHSWEADYLADLKAKAGSKIAPPASLDVKDIFKALETMIVGMLPIVKTWKDREIPPVFLTSGKNLIKSAICLWVPKAYRVRQNWLDTYASFYSSGLVDLFSNWIAHPNGLTFEDIRAIAYASCFAGAERILRLTAKKA